MQLNLRARHICKRLAATELSSLSQVPAAAAADADALWNRSSACEHVGSDERCHFSMGSSLEALQLHPFAAGFSPGFDRPEFLKRKSSSSIGSIGSSFQNASGIVTLKNQVGTLSKCFTTCPQRSIIIRNNCSNREFSGVAKASIDPEFLGKWENEVAEATLPTASSFEGTIVAESSSVSFKFIHPTAVVHPDAIISEGVTIGPFCTVGPGAKLGAGCTLHPSSHIFGNTEIGEGCILLTGAVVGADIPGQTIIGNNNTIGYHAVVGVKCQDMKYKEGEECFLRIGDNNDIREHASVHRSSKNSDTTIIGNNNLIMGSCHIAHDVKLGNNNILANGTLLGGHVVLENFVHTGGAVAVHQFCHIDSYSFLAGGSMVDRDVPMYMMVAGDRAELRGLNLEGIRRCGFSDIEVKSIRRAYQKLFMNSDANAGGLEYRLTDLELDMELAQVEAVVLMLKSVRNCFQEKRRGICKFRHWTCM